MLLGRKASDPDVWEVEIVENPREQKKYRFEARIYRNGEKMYFVFSGKTEQHVINQAIAAKETILLDEQALENKKRITI